MTSTQREPRKTRDRIQILLYLLLGGVCLYAVLLYSTALRAPFTPFLHLVRPAATAVAVGVIAVAAMQMQHPRRKRAWQLQCVTVGGGVLFNIIYLFRAYSVASPLLQMLALVVYGAALLGTGLYLRTIAELVGNSLRVVFAAITVGCAFAIWANITMPFVSRIPLSPEAQAVLSFLAYDIGTLFAVIIVASRHSYPPRSLVYVVICLLFLLAADLLTVSVLWFSWADPLFGGPLYACHSIFLASAAYEDSKETHHPQPLVPSSLSFNQWILWAVVPLSAVLSALSAAALIGDVSPWLVLILVVVAVLHEAIAVHDYHRVTLALNRARLDAAEVAALRERTRIAHDLHDVTNYYSARVLRKLHRALRHLDTRPAVAQREVTETIAQMKQLQRDTRAMSFALRHGQVQPLETAIHTLAPSDDTLAVTISVTGTPYQLPNKVAFAAYRIAQEAFANVIKHAPSATTIGVNVSYYPTRLALTITDNGRDKTQQPPSPTASGLIGMQERTEELGGVLIHGPCNQGYQIHVELPTELNDDSHSGADRGRPARISTNGAERS